MQDNEQGSIRNASWISILPEKAEAGHAFSDEAKCEETSEEREAPPLFALAERYRGSLPERFPRLTFLAIAILLLISALTAELDYLRGAGYSWP